MFLRLQLTQAGLLREPALAEFCQLLFQAMGALFSALALVGVLFSDRHLIVLELPPRLLQLLSQ
ncbi:hypothetical protein GIV66_24450 [Pseudomonas sp. PA-3-11C]|uniref:hypothetical protein n=1 Tax=unclassified Pseudomonas TaxID=196821 RepID=UPI001F32C983|nr:MULTISPECIES: hypothetical protein [unclassified Pseudomonas]MCF5512043.1 hypothetical protein [Pseudomonas sp. PA-3-6H]MCF5518011.1 hypothetical protein [Pseudomonas sp. PA-3-6E]MCF5560794.1 hypothetical protein [Pseudomonas sp. PA-3-5D]MCF5569990.1 hypothetical protein [Pseudomonas sp. PA-3-11C]MCF5593584.1 hypothetical protein [Pseudomonas sp. PA-3-10C]